MKLPQFDDIAQAHKRIKGIVHKTPVFTCESINNISGSKLFFKCENFQKVGAFKYRGATNAVLCLSEEERKKGVATHSSGNHAQALALAAKMNGIKATIIMPETAPEVKKEGVRGYGADIIFCKPTLEARESALNEFVSESGASFIHPFDNFNVIAGQGTAAKELIEELDEPLDFIIAPVGGGGLLSGTCISASHLTRDIKIIAAEPAGADDAKRSLDSGKIQPSINPKTIADGLLTSLSPMTFEIIKAHVDDIITVSDSEIIYAMKLIWERMKIIVEPSSATVLAVALKNPVLFKNKRIGLIISGGNVEAGKMIDMFYGKV